MNASMLGRIELLARRRRDIGPTKRRAHWMNEEPAPKTDTKPPSKSSDDAAAQKAEEASKAKAEELRTALQSKGEQGKSSLGSLAVDED